MSFNQEVRKNLYLDNLKLQIKNLQTTKDNYKKIYSRSKYKVPKPSSFIDDEDKQIDEVKKTEEVYNKLKKIVKKSDVQRFILYLKENNRGEDENGNTQSYLNLFSIYSNDFVKLLKGSKNISFNEAKRYFENFLKRVDILQKEKKEDILYYDKNKKQQISIPPPEEAPFSSEIMKMYGMVPEELETEKLVPEEKEEMSKDEIFEMINKAFDKNDKQLKKILKKEYPNEYNETKKFRNLEKKKNQFYHKKKVVN